MIGMRGLGTHNELSLVSVQGGTLLSLVITYRSQEMRDMILGTGMTTGMEASYTHIERELLAVFTHHPRGVGLTMLAAEVGVRRPRAKSDQSH